MCPDSMGGADSPRMPCPYYRKEKVMKDIIEKFKSLTSEHRHDVLELIKNLYTQESLSGAKETGSEIQI